MADIGQHTYPLVICYIAMENHHAINGKIHYFYGHCQLMSADEIPVKCWGSGSGRLSSTHRRFCQCHRSEDGPPRSWCPVLVPNLPWMDDGWVVSLCNVNIMSILCQYYVILDAIEIHRKMQQVLWISIWIYIYICTLSDVLVLCFCKANVFWSVFWRLCEVQEGRPWL